MKNLAITILVVLLVGVLGLYLVSFQIREIESGLVTTFGKPTDEITEPGWYFKWPAPIQRVYKFDSRMRVFEAEVGETTTKGSIPIIVNSYVVWKISEPLKFFNSVGTVKEAETKLLSQLNNTQNKIVGQHEFSDFVNSDGMNYQAFKRQKEKVNRGKKFIRVKIENPAILLPQEKDGQIAVVRFTQRYNSNNFQSDSRKLFYLKKGQAGWQIIGESRI